MGPHPDPLPPGEGTGVARLVLVKHAMPVVEPGADAAGWRLGDEGREGAVETALARWSNPSHLTDAVRRRGAAEPALIVVAHGTVITLLVAGWCGVEPFPLWERLGLPSYVVLELPERRIVEVVESA